MEKKYSKSIEIFGYHFKKPELLQYALTHPSICKNNEFQRLEFLGDRILNLEIARMIFNNYPHYNAGQMATLFSSLVCGEKIDEITNTYIKPHLISYGKITKNIIADTFEAVIGALFIDGAPVGKIIYKMWESHGLKNIKDDLTPIEKNNIIPPLPTTSYKSTLNLIGGDACHYTHFLVRKDEGSYFQSEVVLHNFKGMGVGKSKKEADEKAAEDILKKIHQFTLEESITLSGNKKDNKNV